MRVITTTVLCVVALGAAGLAHGKGDRFPIDLDEVERRSGEAFADIDTDGDRMITEAEFDAAEPRRGHHRAHRWLRHRHDGADLDAELFAAIDADGNGQLSSEEFADRRAARHEWLKSKAFARLDTNDDGVLMADEFPGMTARLERLDADGDRQVSRSEMKRGREHRQGRAGH